MMMGAAFADYGALVISAKKGEFEAGFFGDGQTKENILLAKSLNIGKLVVVINKMDDPTVRWSKERFNYIVNELKPLVTESGFECIFIPVSA
jgi:peptide chain release factor subunit 3